MESEEDFGVKRGISGGCRDGKGTIEGKIIAKGFIY